MMQASALAWSMYWPAGQGVGYALPLGQWNPSMHVPPIPRNGPPSVGVGVSRPARQKYPSLQLPDGELSPVASQYQPPVQLVQSVDLPTPVLLLKLPRGHENSVANLVPTGQ